MTTTREARRRPRTTTDTSQPSDLLCVLPVVCQKTDNLHENAIIYYLWPLHGYLCCCCCVLLCNSPYSITTTTTSSDVARWACEKGLNQRCLVATLCRLITRPWRKRAPLTPFQAHPEHHPVGRSVVSDTEWVNCITYLTLLLLTMHIKSG